MAMTFDFNIHPFGYGADPIKFGHMRVHSAFDRHEYAIDIKTKDGWRTITGHISKRMPDGTKRSDHRNFLHLLYDILTDVDLDDLGQDYVHVLEDIREAFGNPNLRAGDYKEDE